MKHNSFKNIFIILILSVSVIALFSCKKYLTEYPITSFGPNVAFADVPSAYKTLLGTYSQLSGEQGYGKVLSSYFITDNDETTGPTFNGGVDQADRRSLAHYSVKPNNSEIYKPFLQLYAGIERANLCIKYIPLMSQYSSDAATPDAIELRRMLGEALTLRSQFYLSLIINWGDVPAQYVPSVDVTDPYLPKTNRDSIYDQILNDLKTAEDLVPWRSKVAKDERITLGTVKALRAKIALYRAGYSLRRVGGMQKGSNPDNVYYKIARDECRDIINSGEHDLNISYQAVFKDALDAHRLEPNGEIIFEAAMSGGTSTTSSRFGNYDGPVFFDVTTSATVGQAAISIMPPFFYSFDSLDTRRDVTCAPYAGAGGLTPGTAIKKPTVISKIAFGKFRHDWISNPSYPPAPGINYDVNCPLIRYSDVLLMFAEADNEINGGPSEEAIRAFEKVRTRGFGGHAELIGVTPTGHDDFFNAIVNERSFEFAGEGLRKYDLIRWNLLKTKITDTKAKMDIMINTGVDPYPPYDSIPKSMMYLSNSPDLIFSNSFYHKTPSSTPTGYTKTNWLQGFIPTIALYSNYAQYFQENHSELLPIHQDVINSNFNLSQDYGY